MHWFSNFIFKAIPILQTLLQSLKQNSKVGPVRESPQNSLPLHVIQFHMLKPWWEFKSIRSKFIFWSVVFFGFFQGCQCGGINNKEENVVSNCRCCMFCFIVNTWKQLWLGILSKMRNLRICEAWARSPRLRSRSRSRSFPKITIAIPIPIAIWKMIGDHDLDRSFAIADLFSNLLNYWLYRFFSSQI